ncbi:Peptide methionine sulfoxide reductase B5 [Sporothrix epigloea]|uniref:Peptide-methionine (R)-S-oxide reductase n=1 Tax=Sporothrix epigloea TaxID=1892477 RepID=A0ABP0DH84_9PEZI
MPVIPFLSSFFSTSATQQQDDMSFPDQRTSSEWQAVLNPKQFRILREKGTEAPYTGEYDKHFADAGVYRCAGCEAPLYKASHKFKSGCGWPAYFDSLPGAVKRNVDSTLGMQRTEIVCANCGGHLGHVFKGEGYATPTDERHCVNSISLKFSAEDEAEAAKNADSTASKA